MICQSLNSMPSGHYDEGFTPRGLSAGARMVNEPKLRPDYHVGNLEVQRDFAEFHFGLDASINHMLQGGNGYPDPHRDGLFDLACTQERRDLRSMKQWQASLSDCKADRLRGATS